MTDSIISAKAVIDWSDLGKFDEAVNSLINKAQGRRAEATGAGSAAAGSPRGGTYVGRAPLTPAEEEEAQGRRTGTALNAPYRSLYGEVVGNAQESLQRTQNEIARLQSSISGRSTESLSKAQNDYALALQRRNAAEEEQNRRREAGITRNVSQARFGGLKGYSDKEIQDEITSAKAQMANAIGRGAGVPEKISSLQNNLQAAQEKFATGMTAWSDKVVDSLLANVKGIQAIMQNPEGVSATAQRDLARRLYGRATLLESDQLRENLGVPSRYQESLADKLQYQQGRIPEDEAAIRSAQQLKDQQIRQILLPEKYQISTEDKLQYQQVRNPDQEAQIRAIKEQQDRIAKINTSLANYAPSSTLSASGNDALTQANRKLADIRSQDAASEAAIIVAQEQYRRSLQTAITEQRRSEGIPGLGFGQGGSLWQQFMGWSRQHRAGGGGFGGGGGGIGGGGLRNEDLPNFGQFLAGHAGTTLGYAIPGIAIGVGFEEIRKAVEESQKAQRSMSELRAQFEGLGQGNQFTGFADSIKNIASQTGVAVSEVTELGMAMKGVYGDTTQATIATQAIAQATVTMGMGLQEARQDLTAISQGFDALSASSGTTMTKINNELLHLQDLTGVTAKSLAPGVADVASTAGAVGFSRYQTESIIAAASQRSGLSSETIGETFSKIITNLSSNPQLRIQTEQLLSGIPGSGVPQNAATLGMSQQIQVIMQGLSKLLQNPGSAAFYANVLSNLGINSSALPSANALFSTGQKAAQLATTVVPANRSQEEFKKQMDTLTGRLEQLRSDFTNLGVAILNSGFGKALTQFVNLLGLGVKGLTDINSITHGLAGEFTVVVGALVGFKALVGVGTTLVGVLTRLAGAATADTVALEENAVAGKSSVVRSFLPIGASAAAEGGAAAEVSLLPPVAAGLIATYLGSKIIPAIIGGPSQSQISQNIQNTYDALNNKTNAPPGTPLPIGANAPSFTRPGQLTGIELTAAQKAAGWTIDSSGKISYQMPANTPGKEVYNASKDSYEFVPTQSPISPRLPLTPGQINAGYTEDLYNRPILPTRPSVNSGSNITFAEAIKNPATANYFRSAAEHAVQTIDVTGTQALYQTGAATSAQLLNALTLQTKGLLEAFKEGPSTTSYEAYAQSIQQLNQQLDQEAQQAQQTAQSLQSTGNPALDAINATNALTLALKSHGPQNILSALTTYTGDIQTLWQDQANNAVTGAAKIAALTQTAAIPADVLAKLKKSLTPQQFAELPTSITGFVPGTQQYQFLSQDVQAAQALAQAAAVEDPVKLAIANAQAAAINAQNAKAKEGVNSNDYKQAQAALQEANQQVVDAQNQATQSQYSMLAQVFSNTPIIAAQYTLKQLQTALADAHGTAQINQIKGQIAQTQEQLSQAQIAQSDALSAITQATLTAQGNPIQAALVKYHQDLQDIATRRRFDIAHGMNPSQDTQLQQQIAQSITDSTNYLQTQYSTISSQVQAELYIGQITATAAIAQLEAGMANARGNRQLVLEYEQEIRQIQNSAGANLSFDLPQTLFAPTLYEARRIESGHTFAAGGPNTNIGNVNVTINVNGGSAASVNSAVSKLTQAVAGPQRTGTLGPILNG